MSDVSGMGCMGGMSDVSGTAAEPPAGCRTCAAVDRAEREATAARDHSLATDWRVRRRRHQDADHRDPVRSKPQCPEPDHPAP